MMIKIPDAKKFAWATSSVPAQLLPRTTLRQVRLSTHPAGPQWELSAQHPNGRCPEAGSEFDTYTYTFASWDDSPDEGKFFVYHDHGDHTAFLTDAAYDAVRQIYDDTDISGFPTPHPISSAGALGFNADVFWMLCNRRSFIQAITQLQ